MNGNPQNALEEFRKLFPLSNVYVEANQMRYTLPRDIRSGRRWESEAQALIINNHLPLCADLAVWQRKGCILGVQLIIEAVPAEELVEQ